MRKTDLPTPWLSFAILVHGVFGSSGEIIELVLNRLPVPLSVFYNESVSSHYGISLDAQSSAAINSTMMNCAYLGCMISAFILLPRMDSWGRKAAAVYLRTAIFTLAAGLMVAAKLGNSVEVFAVSQVVLGLARPFRLGATKIYISECAPDRLRGFATQAVNELSIYTIFVVGFFTLPGLFGGVENWYMIGTLSAAFAVLFIASGSLVPDSPKFLAFKGENALKVAKSVKAFYGPDISVESVVKEYSKEFLTMEEPGFQHHVPVRLGDLWNNDGFHDTLLLLAVTAFVPFIGAPVIYSVNGTSLMMRFGFSNDAAILINSATNALAIPVGIALPVMYEKLGRRPSYLAALAANLLAILALVVGQVFIDRGSGPGTVTQAAAITWSMAFSLTMALGLPDFGMILVGDLLPANTKLVGTQMFLLVLNATAIVVTFAYAQLDGIIGAGVYVLMAALQLACWIFLASRLPETRLKAIVANYQAARSRAQSRRLSLLPPLESRPDYGTVNNHTNGK